jgi:lysophospholipid acyltransferase (LPLAT)-like uncharacterized protein
MKLRLEHPWFRRTAPALVRGLCRLLLATCSHRVAAHPEALRWVRSGAPFIFTAWHCHLLSTIFAWPRLVPAAKPPVLMASPSRDGEFIGEVARGLGFIVCAGSRHKGGLQTLHTLVDYLRQGHPAGLIADGSRGPARRVQKGVPYLAREAQVPIIPVAAAASRKFTLNTWDRFEIPWPGCRLTYAAGPPLWVPAGARAAELEERRRTLEESLSRLAAA